MSNTKEIVEKRAAHLSEDAELVCRWLERRQAVDNSLSPAILDGLDAIGCIQFELKNRCSKDEDYSNLLSAKIFQTFGVYHAGVAAAAFTDCEGIAKLRKRDNFSGVDWFNLTFHPEKPSLFC